MKIALLTLSALVASATAAPIRLLTLTRSDSPDSPSRSLGPCHGGRPHLSPMDPIGALLESMGITQTQTKTRSRPDFHQLEEFIRSAGEEFVPVLQGGAVRILPAFTDDIVKEIGDGEMEREWDGEVELGMEGEMDQRRPGPERHGWEDLEGKSGVRKYRHHPHGPGPHHQHHMPTFTDRLDRAMMNLSPTESMIIAFVLGAGIGSIIHMIFMILLITFRVMRRSSKREGRVRLEQDQVEAEILPGYEESVTAVVISEKA